MRIFMDLIPPTPMEEFFWSLGIYTTGAKIALFAGVFAVQTALVMGNGGKVTVPLYAVALSALLISGGMLLGGKKIVESLSRFSPTMPINGFVADVTSSVALIIMSLLGAPFFLGLLIWGGRKNV